MNRTCVRLQICIATALLATFVPRYAKGDGGIIRLRGTQGAFSVTVFTSPEAVANGLADVSVLVQGSESGKVVLDADVRLTLSPPSGLAMKQADELCGLPAAAMRLPNEIDNPVSVRATRQQASNKLLYAALVDLGAPGNWKLRLFVSRGSDTAQFDCVLPVTLSSGELAGLWPYLSLPPLVVVLFAVNQWLRGQSLQKSLRQLNAV
jgi:hypothetical protein